MHTIEDLSGPLVQAQLQDINDYLIRVEDRVETEETRVGNEKVPDLFLVSISLGQSL